MSASPLDRDTRGGADLPNLAELIMYLAAMAALLWLATDVIAGIPPLPF